MTRIYNRPRRFARAAPVMRGGLIAMASALLGGIFPAPVHAGEIEDALAIADKVHPTACKPLRLERPPELVNVGASAEASQEPCIMRVRPRLEDDRSWAEFCSIIVHERGHNAGLEHSLDPRSNMHVALNGDSAPPRPAACGPSDEELERRGEMRETIQDTRADVRYQKRLCARSRGPKLTKCRRDLRADKRYLRKLRARYARRVAKAPRVSTWL